MGAFALLPVGAFLSVLTDAGLVASQSSASAAAALVSALVGATAVGGTTWAFCRYVDGRPLASLGIGVYPGWVRQLAGGFALGAILIVLIFAVGVGGGYYRIEAVAWEHLAASRLLGNLGGPFLLFALVAVYEELMARGYLLQNLAADWGLWIAVAGSSALFAFGHLLNPGAGLVSTLGLFVAGILLASGYLATRSLWLPIGLHLSWNFFQGPVFGFPVSGLVTPGLLRLSAQGPEVLTGGAFGPEASLVGIGAEVVGIGVIWLFSRRGPGAAPHPPGPLSILAAE